MPLIRAGRSLFWIRLVEAVSVLGAAVLGSVHPEGALAAAGVSDTVAAFLDRVAVEAGAAH